MLWRSAGALLLALVAFGDTAAAAARAQQPTAGVIDFTTPDGSRFVLVPAADMPLVHWAIATVADDPPGFAGLSAATMSAALAGTWRSGSRDPAREPMVLDQLDSAYRTWLENRADAAASAEFVRLSGVVEQLSDPVAHTRALAAVPMYRPEVVDRPPACVYVTSTVPDALPAVAQRLLERREQSALRDLQGKWVQTLFERAQRQQQDDRLQLHAEVLALAMPDHPFLPLLERPGLSTPQRTVAMATWSALQRPERTVHVLCGGFDAEAVQALLVRTFDHTDLAPAAPLPTVRARPITSVRRSALSGAAAPTVALAFVLPAGVDRSLLEVAARWLGDGADSRLGQELPRNGRPRAEVSCHAPWPPTRGGQSLLLLEVTDPAGIQGLADLLRKLARDATAAPPTPATVDAALAAVQRHWTAATNDPRQFAVAVAVDAVLWPDRPPRTTLPDHVEPRALRNLLAEVLNTQPVVVEARP